MREVRVKKIGDEEEVWREKKKSCGREEMKAGDKS